MGLAEATQEGIAYGEWLRRRRSPETKTAFLARIGTRNLTDPGTDDALFAKLIGDISARKPFSLIRLGDGEGNILFWGSHKADFPALAQFGMESIWSLMFGRAPGEDAFDDLYQCIAQAVPDADYVGIPFPDQDEHSIEQMRDPPNSTVGIRGSMGQAAVWDWISAHALSRIEHGNQIVVNAHFHTSLPGYLAQIMGETKRLSLITCYPDLLKRFVRRFTIDEGQSYLIPPQRSNIKRLPENVHFPDRFRQIDAELSARDLTGELFFVGAGPPGKAYCARIKQQGGMAIDVGSMMDVWMGIGVRKYQDAAYVLENRLEAFDEP